MSVATSTMLDENNQSYRIIINGRDMTDINTLVQELRIATKSSEAANQTLRKAIAANEKQNWLKTGETQLNNQMQESQQSLAELTRRIVSFIAVYIDAYVGVIFIMQGEILNLTAMAWPI